MASDETEDTTPYVVLMNCEEQYSLMPKAISTVPNGWTVMKEGTRAECGAYVNEVWTDMRPLSLRKHMQEFAQKQKQQQAPDTAG
jgi:MbtH protein